MHALFVAYGPKFKQNYTVDPFQNVEIYNLMCGKFYSSIRNVIMSNNYTRYM